MNSLDAHRATKNRLSDWTAYFFDLPSLGGTAVGLGGVAGLFWLDRSVELDVRFDVVHWVLRRVNCLKRLVYGETRRDER